MKSFAILALAATVSLISAACPNLCNGNGNCGSGDICTCYANWQGADCSERICAYGLAWVDAPTASTTAHKYAECSNAGLCDRTSGLCDCFPGYEGNACARSSCPNSCSGHGTCYYIEDITTSNGKFAVDYTSPLYGVYNLWDVSKTQGCVCDPYYEGADCSLRSCPKGSNVLLSTVAVDTQIICLADQSAGSTPAGQFTLTFTDLYGGIWTTRPINTVGAASDLASDTVTAAEIQAALQNLPNQVIPSVTVVPYTGGSAKGLCYTVSFTDQANTGIQNTLKVNIGGCTRAGCAPFYSGLSSHLGSGADGGVVATVTDGNVAANVWEAAVCSDHGLCDSSSGICNCFSGFYDLDCNEQTVLV